MIAVARGHEGQLSSQIPQGRSWQSFHRRLASRPNAFFDNYEQMHWCTESNVDPLRPDRLNDLRGQPVAALAAPRRNLARSNVDGSIDVDRGVAIIMLVSPIAIILAPSEAQRMCTACRGRIRLRDSGSVFETALRIQLQCSGVVQHGGPTLIVFSSINGKTLAVLGRSAADRRIMKPSSENSGSMAR